MVNGRNQRWTDSLRMDRQMDVWNRRKLYSKTCVKQAPKGKAKSGRCLLKTGKFTLVWPLWDLKSWPLKTGDCLIQVAFKSGLTVYPFGILCMPGVLKEKT